MTQRKAMLCPRCRHLVGSEEDSCSWCGAARPSSLWLAAAWTRGALDGETLVRWILGANIAFFLLSLSVGGGGLSPDQGSLVSSGATGAIPVFRLGRYWTLFSASYLHGGILHIFFNMMALRQIAPWVVREYGAARMFIIYTLGGVCGFALSTFSGVPLTIGASAAICGLIGALLYYGRSRGGLYGQAVYREVSGWVVGLILFGFIFPGIDNWAHGGGILGGMALGSILGYAERRRENFFHLGVAVLCGAATVITLALGAWGGIGYLAHLR